jgi:trehalose-6-phosphate synthase
MLDPVRYYPHIAAEVLWSFLHSFVRSLVRWLVRCEGQLSAPPSL